MRNLRAILTGLEVTSSIVLSADDAQIEVANLFRTLKCNFLIANIFDADFINHIVQRSLPKATKFTKFSSFSSHFRGPRTASVRRSKERGDAKKHKHDGNNQAMEITTGILPTTALVRLSCHPTFHKREWDWRRQDQY